MNNPFQSSVNNILSLVMRDLDIDSYQDASYISEVETVLENHTNNYTQISENNYTFKLNPMLSDLESLDKKYYDSRLYHYVMNNLHSEEVKQWTT